MQTNKRQQLIDTMGVMKGDQLQSLAQKNLENYNKLID